jgi:hypothetical protein
MSDFYHVRRMVCPWMAGTGFIAGLPVFMMDIGQGGDKVSSDDIVSWICKYRAKHHKFSPRWLAVIGDDDARDNELLLFARVRGQLLTYVETDGTRSICDHDDRLPMWEHVAIRATLPLPEIKTEIFHSVSVRAGFTLEDLVKFSDQLDRLAYNGVRYIEGGAENVSIVARMGKNWRLTRPLAPDVRVGTKGLL